jgi:hypothetical protein
MVRAKHLRMEASPLQRMWNSKRLSSVYNSSAFSRLDVTIMGIRNLIKVVLFILVMTTTIASCASSLTPQPDSTTSGANLQADSAVFELTQDGIDVDFHLSGAMSNRVVAVGATPASPVTLTVDDMYTLMPYENSLLVMSMNGPQIKEVLERGYRNWWWYNQGWPWGDYSHYTTCMLTTDAGNVITYTGGSHHRTGWVQRVFTSPRRRSSRLHR